MQPQAAGWTPALAGRRLLVAEATEAVLRRLRFVNLSRLVRLVLSEGGVPLGLERDGAFVCQTKHLLYGVAQDALRARFDSRNAQRRPGESDALPRLEPHLLVAPLCDALELFPPLACRVVHDNMKNAVEVYVRLGPSERR